MKRSMDTFRPKRHSASALLLILLIHSGCDREDRQPNSASDVSDQTDAAAAPTNGMQVPLSDDHAARPQSPASAEQDPPCFDRSAWRKTIEYGPEGLVNKFKGFIKATDGTPTLIYEMKFIKVNEAEQGYQYDCYPSGPAAAVANSRGEFKVTTYVIPYNEWKVIFYYPVHFSKVESKLIKYYNVRLPKGGATREAIREETLWSLHEPPRVYHLRGIYHQSGDEPYLMSIEMLPEGSQ